MTELSSVRSADRAELVERWKNAFGCEPPARVHTGLMRGVLAWHVQCEANGIQTATTSHETDSKMTSSTLRSGARLLREWRGVTHEVLVAGEGFLYAGKTYKSLSAIARAITGTHWSGPLFFGIKR